MPKSKSNKKTSIDTTRTLLEERNKKILPAQQKDFKKKDEKETGVSAGYQAVNKTGQRFLIKQAYKTHDEAVNAGIESLKKYEKEAVEVGYILEKRQKQRILNQPLLDRRDYANEMMGGELYKYAAGLYYKAPYEQAVYSDNKHQNSVYLSSRFFQDAITLSEFSGAEDSIIDPTNAKLKEIKNFPHVIASIDALGEVDGHGGNLMKGKDGLYKIDHGRSFMQFHSDFKNFLAVANTNFDLMRYKDAINNGNLKFNIKEYSQALNQTLLNQENGGLRDQIIDKKIDELEKIGFDPKGIEMLSSFGHENWKRTKINNFEDLRNFYKESLNANLQNMKEIARDVEIISKFTGVDDKFKNGEWLHSFGVSGIKDPIAYAIAHNIKIEEKDPREWAMEQGYQLDANNARIKEPPVAPIAHHEEIKWKKTTDGKWIENAAIENEGESAAISHAKKDLIRGGADSSSTIALNITKDIEKFSEKYTGKKVNKGQVQKLFMDTIDRLDGIPIDKGVRRPDREIYHSKDFKDEVERTTELFNSDIPKIGLKNRAKICISNLLDKFGYANDISKDIRSKIDVEKQKRISNIQEALNVKIKQLTTKTNDRGSAQEHNERHGIIMAKVEDNIKDNIKKKNTKGGTTHSI